MKDGIIRPDQVSGEDYGSDAAQAYQQQTADSIYDYFNEVLDEREAEREDDLLSRFLDAEVEGERLTREDILDICFLFLIAGLDTVTSTLDCMFAYLARSTPTSAASSSTIPRSSRLPSRSCCAGRHRSWVSPAWRVSRTRRSTAARSTRATR